MINGIVIGILLLIAGGIAWYLIRAKRKGQACIGCPYGKQCNGSCAGDRGANRAEEP